MGEHSNKKLVICFSALVYFGLSNRYVFLREKVWVYPNMEIKVFHNSWFSVFSEPSLNSKQFKKISAFGSRTL